MAVGEAYRPLSPLEMRRLLAEVKELGTEFCRQCGYCLPCPSGIDIPIVFRLEGYHDRYDAANGPVSNIFLWRQRLETASSAGSVSLVALIGFRFGRS